MIRLFLHIKFMRAVAICTMCVAACAAIASASASAATSVRTQRSIHAPSRAAGATIATIVAPTQARVRPGTGRTTAMVQTYTFMTGTPQSLMVLGSRIVHGVLWLKVLLARRPDGSTGWINSNYVDLSSTRYWIHVSLAQRRVFVFRGGRLVSSFAAVIGAPWSPTPTGLTSVYEKDRQSSPNDYIGSWALTLALFSHALKHFDGGPGEIAIHGRGGASLDDQLGTAESHGCVRVDNSNMDWLASHVPVGTPVRITAS